MGKYQIIEPGSLDIEEVNVHLGGIDIESPDRLLEVNNDWDYQGNKFITAEHFVDVNGYPTENNKFDTRVNCYSLFIAPISKSGRHQNIIGHHREQHNFDSRIGVITGGGMIRTPAKNIIEIGGMSGDFKCEPDYLRAKFAKLLLEELSLKFNNNGLEIAESTLNSESYCPEFGINYYWLRYAQVLETAKERVRKELLTFLLQCYIDNQEHIARNS